MVILDPHKSHGHVHETHGHKTTASHGHGQEEHTHGKVEKTGTLYWCSGSYVLVTYSDDKTTVHNLYKYKPYKNKKKRLVLCKM